MRVASFVTLVIILCPQLELPLSGKAWTNSDRSRLKRATLQQPIDREVARIWEEAIAAKGGRARLLSVRNILISSRVNYVTGKGKKNQLRRETLCVFPNRYWSYEDYGSDVFGATMLMWDYDNMTMYFGSPGHPGTRLEPMQGKNHREALDNIAISLLLETRWIKPVLLRARTDTIGLTKVDVVEATVNDRRVDFAFDRQTHLPVQVSFYDAGRDKTYVNVQRFSDYVEVDGIKMPETHMYSEGIPEYRGTVDKAVIQFNVDYNPEIFLKPPAKRGPEAWRK